MSPNEALSSTGGENVGVRGLSIFDHETLKANVAIGSSDTAFRVKLPDGTTTAAQIRARFPLGSYIQIDGEIMRVASNTLGGGSGDELSVVRGSLGTISSAHPTNSKIKKIKPLAIEFRRPSILRASGHTFEYLGYGPGNYSTALPQLQNRTLSEREEFLSQSQETSCGNVVYTGMNDKGDFYIGNTKISSSSGQQTTFDIPIPTITGEDPNRLSIVADEVIVKERLLVEGGVSKQILSQFDGPVTFNENVRLANPNKTLTSVSDVNITNTTNPTSISSPTALKVAGGVSIGSSVFIGGDLIGSGSPLPNISGITSVTAVSFYGDGAGLTNTGAQLSAASGTQRVVLTSLTTGTMTSAATEDPLKYVQADGKLFANVFSGNLLGDVTGDLTGDVTGDLTGNADTATTAGNVSFGSANQVVFKNSSNNGATSSNLTFDGSNLTVNDGDIVSKKFLKLDGTATNSGDIHTAGGHDGIAVIQNTSNQGKIRIASKNSNGSSDITIASFNIESNQPIFRCDGDIVAFNSSDISMKENISPIENALKMINSLSGNIFAWKPGFANKGMDTGIIAQEVEALGLPGITATRQDGTKGVRYDRLIPVLIEAVKELTAKVDALENK